MSYCRYYRGESDVYVIGTKDSLECFGARHDVESVNPVHNRILVNDWGRVNGEIVQLETKHEIPDIFRTLSRREMIEHLKKHREAGHIVPDYAIERLEHEINTEGDEYNDDL